MSTDITKPRPSSELMQRPEFFDQQEVLGTEGIGEYIKPPRVKVVQPQSRAPFSEQFNKGDVVLVPQMQIVAPVVLSDKGKPTNSGTPFHFIPLFFFPEWCTWNPIQMQGQLPVIRERTFDTKSELARKAKVKEMWFEKCPENPEFNIRHCEHLNFIVLLTGNNPFAGTTCVISYARGTYRSGSTLLSLVQMRNASIFGCQFEAKAQLLTNEKGEWYTLDATNPSPASNVSPWVTDKEVYAKLKDMHTELKEAHAKSLIIIEHDDDELLDSGSGRSESSEY